MIIGYVRETLDNDVQPQRQAILKYANQHHDGVHFELIEESLRTRLSGSAPSDVLVVYCLECLAKSRLELFETMKIIRTKNIHLVSLLDGIDTTTPNGVAIFNAIERLERFEKNLSREREKIASSTPKPRRKVGGRPPVIQSVKEDIRRRYARGNSASLLAKEYGIGRSTIYKILNEPK